MAQTWCGCGYGIAWQLLLSFDPQPGNLQMSWVQRQKKKSYCSSRFSCLASEKPQQPGVLSGALSEDTRNTTFLLLFPLKSDSQCVSHLLGWQRIKSQLSEALLAVFGPLLGVVWSGQQVQCQALGVATPPGQRLHEASGFCPFCAQRCMVGAQDTVSAQ